MLERKQFPVLLIADTEPKRAAGRALRTIVERLELLGHAVVETDNLADGRALVASDPSFGVVMLDWDVETDALAGSIAVLEAVRARSPRLPILLLVEQSDFSAIPAEITESVQECILVFEDTPGFIAGRVDFAWRRYVDQLLPPYFKALVEFDGTHEYSMHTPGHAGGTAFRKTAVGKSFYDFYGETLFRTDLAVALGPLRAVGSLLDHTGAVADAERHAARVFGSDYTYFVLNGTSTSNQIVAHSAIVDGDVVLLDRNCHKSMSYAITVTRSTPVYLMPARNGYGIIGPIPASSLSPDAVAQSIADSPIVDPDAPVTYAAVTNSTYDGLCYNARTVTAQLKHSSPRIHFDEAWFAYARFNPLYRDRFAMHDDPDPDGPTLFATQSTHKLLAAFSQASMIHIRSTERAPVTRSRFNEAYMMHSSTSPFYPMIASLDVAAAMMEHPTGLELTEEAILEAIGFRKRVAQLHAEYGERGDWFFDAWQPPTAHDPQTEASYRFAEAPDELLAREPSCWTLDPGAEWHGFGDVEPGYCLLDPIKVTITTPGVDAAGNMADHGIPAQVVTHFLSEQRIEIEKTGDYTFLLLFSIGMTKGKWGTLIDGLLAFKRAYDQNLPVTEVLPSLVAQTGGRYAEIGLRDLCDELHAQMRALQVTKLLDAAYSELPEPVVTPALAYRELVRARTEQVPLSAIGGRVAAAKIVPYPPGIPVLMPGERVGAGDGPVLAYLLALQSLDSNFPGFEHDIHGIEQDDDGGFLVECIVE